MYLDPLQGDQGRFSIPDLRNWTGDVRKVKRRCILLQGKNKRWGLF